MSIEKKYKDAFLRSNHLSVVITSNNSPIKMDKNDRRYLMSDVSNHRAKDEEYFKKLYSFMKNDIIQKAFYFNCKTIASEMSLKKPPNYKKILYITITYRMMVGETLIILKYRDY